MSHINTIIMSGRLGADPEMKRFEGDKQKTSLRLASTRRWGSGEDQQETTWVDVECWAGLAGVVNEHCKKGQESTVQGRLNIEPWTDREGAKRVSTRIKADSIHFGPKAGNGGGSVSKNLVEEKVRAALNLLKEKIPFDVAVQAVMER